MLRVVNRRTPFVRFLGILWATLQLASPGVSAIADGYAAREGAGQAATHVEATSTERCPIVHSPDCAVCRYLSNSGSEPPMTPSFASSSERAADPAICDSFALSAAAALPQSRAPPAI